MRKKATLLLEVAGKIIRVALYIRVSHEEQKRHGYSLEAQKETLIKFAKEMGWKVVDFYIDEGITARKSLKKRKEFQRLLQDIRENKIDMVIFIKLDRWFRNVADYYKTQEVLNEHNCGWIATEEEYDTTTANGRLHLNIKLSIAQNESDQTSDRINYIFESKREKGQVTSGAKIKGYDIKNYKTDLPKYYVINEEEQAILIDCHDFCQKNQGSIKQTMLYHNSKYKPAIGYDTMRKWLTNTAYINQYKKYKSDVVIPDYTPRLMSDEFFYETQRMIEKNIRASNRTGQMTDDAMFDGLLYCPCCTAKFSRKIVYDENNKPKNVYYNCWKSLKFGKDGEYFCKNNLSTNEKKLEAYFMENFKKEAEKFIVKNTIVGDSKKDQPKDNSASIKKKMEKLADLYMIDKIDKDYYLKEYEKLKKELDENNRKLSRKKVVRNLDKIKNLLKKDFAEIYEQLDQEQKRKFWINTIDKIYIKDGIVEDVDFL